MAGDGVNHRVNICFHGIGRPSRDLEPGEALYWITEEMFGQILDYAARVPHLDLSFDDGNASDTGIALPELAARSLKGTFFPVAARVGRPGSVDGAGLRSLVRHGMTVGSHGMHHRSWRGLSAAELDEELVHAREIIAQASGMPVGIAACPLGAYDRTVLQRMRSLRYTQVFTSDRAIAPARSWLQPRYSVRTTDDIEDVRDIVERPRSLTERVASTARIAVKRLR
jgi:peptidoglycan/xylan/chitin deacetylase (PgdA/CDA1 family)